MRVLFIGGTGMISTATTRLAVEQGHDVFVLNRGFTGEVPAGARVLTADVHEPRALEAALRNLEFDAVVDWIAYTPADVERDLTLFRGRVGQYVLISSASVYQKPPERYLISEQTPLSNPYWRYAQDKIACEERLMRAFQESRFPAVIVRPSMTYDHNLPTVFGWGTYTLADRLLRRRPIIAHGDGTSLWTVTHADDLARGLVGLLGNERAAGEAFHITSDEVLTWNDIYRTIGRSLGVEPQIVHVPSDFIVRLSPEMEGSLLGDKMHSVVFDNAKIKQCVPDFRATIPLRRGIHKTIQWFEGGPGRRSVDAAVDVQIDRILEVYGEMTF